MGLRDDLGAGLRAYAGTVSPEIYQQQQQVDTQKKTAIANQVLKGIEDGRVPPQQGAQVLAKLGYEMPENVLGPSVEAQQRQVTLKKQQDLQAFMNSPEGQAFIQDDDLPGLQKALVAKGLADPLATMKEERAASKPVVVGDNIYLPDTKEFKSAGENGGTAKPTEAARKKKELMAQGYPEDQATAIAYGMVKVVPTADGGTAVIRTDNAIGGKTGGAQPTTQPTSQPSQPPSPYAPSGPLPGQVNRTIGNKPAQDLKKDVQDFKTDIQKMGIPTMDASFSEVDSLLSKYKDKDGNLVKDLPGYGSSSYAPDFMISDDGKKLRQAISKISNVELKNRSGAAVTTPEFDRWRNELGSGNLKTDKQLLYGLQQLKKAYDAIKRNEIAGYPREVIVEYKRNGGRLDLDETSNVQAPEGWTVKVK